MQEEMMFCGAGSLKDVDKDELSGGGKEKKAPEVAKTKKKQGGRKENPYASRGLDKFSTVLAELESQREKVLRRVDGGDRVMVRFVQSEGKGWVPIVVKLPPEEQAADAKGDSKKKCKPAAVPTAPPSQPSTTRTTESTSPREDVVKHAAAAAKAQAVAAAPAKKKAAAGRWSWGRKAMRPSHYWPFVAVLLLVSLVVFGRVFAICCTSVWWYLVPILSGSDGGEEGLVVRRALGKIGKDLGKKASDKKISEKLAWAPLPPSHGKTSSSGAHEVISPRSHAHGKKG